ncbi:MAG TPA: hydroxymethylglutaryl-CoA reductase [bacterium]|nr:hydroxymethylglutaryl-CoA reductase [bacterium]HPN44481.1 hydroxymethylglutaryl-CoA reductase [bacterium]
MLNIAAIPMQTIGPVKITGPVVNEEIMVPLATFETPLWPSTNRGARVSVQSGGIRAVITDDRMTRSVLVEAPDAEQALAVKHFLQAQTETIRSIIESTSRYARFIEVKCENAANLLYIRIAINAGDASGHNMTTKAADAFLDWLLAERPELRYLSVSGNYCVDKKVSAVNGILGRGKHVITELVVPEKLCRRYLKTTPEKIVELNIKKNLLGTMLGGGIRTANAHFANILLAFYLATGQDAANIIEGSQGTVHAEVRNGDLYFAATLPNVIVGTVGNGKDLDFVRNNLQALGCLEQRKAGGNAQRLAVIAAAAVLCGELSLMAALTNRGELMRTHEKLER